MAFKENEYYIELVGDNAETKAQKIAEYYGTRVEDKTFVVSNKDIEKEITWSEGELEATCHKLSDELRMLIVPDDFEF